MVSHRISIIASTVLISTRGFSICRALALQHPTHCIAVHTANPTFLEPTWKRGALGCLKYHIAKLTRAKISLLSFGYLPSEIRERPIGQSPKDVEDSLDLHQPMGPTLHRLYSLRPQTLAFSLCDSPVGLLAALLDVIHTRAPSLSPITSRSRSPFLSPVELEMQHNDDGQDTTHSIATERVSNPMGLQRGDMDVRSYTWSPTEMLNFTMLQWLPGPEAVSISVRCKTRPLKSY